MLGSAPAVVEAEYDLEAEVSGLLPCSSRRKEVIAAAETKTLNPADWISGGSN